MSRSPSLAPFAHQGFHDERPSERRATPAYYATPHSEAIPDFNAYQRGGSRGPIIVPNGYEPDDEEMDDSFDDPGSSTDPYDSQMTDDVNDGAAKTPMAHRRSVSNDDSDIDVYEDDDEDELDGIETDGGNDPSAWRGFGQGQAAMVKAEQPRPEDIPWAGIEDLMSDGENVDPDSQDIEIHEDEDIEVPDNGDADDTDARSGTSSQAPSEYSSKPHAHQGLWPVPSTTGNNIIADHDKGYHRHAGMVTATRDSSMGFQIHEDENHDNQ